MDEWSRIVIWIHVYEKCGYQEIPKPEAVVHGGMNRFYLKRSEESSIFMSWQNAFMTDLKLICCL